VSLSSGHAQRSLPGVIAVFVCAVSSASAALQAQGGVHAMAARPLPVAAHYDDVPRTRVADRDQPGGGGMRRADAWKVGGLSALAMVLATADRRGDAWARRPAVQNSATLDAFSRVGDVSGSVVGMGVGPALWLLGRARSDSGMAVQGLRTTEAVFVSGVAITAIKLLAGRTRPFASADNSPTHWDLLGGFRSDSTRSFASGHTAVATAAAVTLAAEWRRQGARGWSSAGPPLVYALATVTAGSRVRDRQHWLSDVVSGAAVGVVSALVVRRWHDAHPRNRVDRTFLRR